MRIKNPKLSDTGISKEKFFQTWEDEKYEVAKKCIRENDYEEDFCIACEMYDICNDFILSSKI